MSEWKWVNRNIRTGNSGGLPPSETGYRRDYVHKRSSRGFKMNDRKAKARSRRSRLRRANRLSMLATFLVCGLTVAAVWFYLRAQKLSTPPPKDPAESRQVFADDPGPDPIAHDPSESVQDFLLARSVADLAKLGRMDDNSPALIRQHGPEIIDWNKGHIQWTGLHEARANGLIFSAFNVTHASEPKRLLYVVQTPFGARVDVGAFLGWCSESWGDLTSGKVTQATTVRAVLSRIPYYNFRFSDESAWQSYRLASLDGSQSVYGYAARGTNTHRALESLLPKDSPSFLAIVSLDQGEIGSDRRQFRISRALAAGWIMGPEILEDNLPKLVEQPVFQPTNPPPPEDPR